MATTASDDIGGKTAVFEMARPQLMGLAYRMLGSLADAEDAVQDTFVKWQSVDVSKLRNAEAWLTTVCTNRCLDLLKAASRNRLNYVGPWIPEPLQTETLASPEDDLDRAQSLTTAFLLLLDRLSPKERAAFLLREVFGKPYKEVADTLTLSEASCRQLVSRAARSVREEKSRFRPSADQQAAFLAAFQLALETGRSDQLAHLLAENVSLSADSGGKVVTISRVLQGPREVSGFVVKALRRYWGPIRLVQREVNGLFGLVAVADDGVHAVMTLGYNEDGTVGQIYIVRNPDKLARLDFRFRHQASDGSLTPD